MKKVNYKLARKIGLLILAMCFVGGSFWVIYSLPQVKEVIALATTKKSETFTELYFEDHLSLPDKIEPGKEEFVKFTIHNKQYKTMNYKYETKVIDGVGEEVLSSGSVVLNHDEYQTIYENYILTGSSGKIKFQVLLVDQNQSIHFWMGQADREEN